MAGNVFLGGGSFPFLLSLPLLFRVFHGRAKGTYSCAPVHRRQYSPLFWRTWGFQGKALFSSELEEAVEGMLPVSQHWRQRGYIDWWKDCLLSSSTVDNSWPWKMGIESCWVSITTRATRNQYWKETWWLGLSDNNDLWGSKQRLSYDYKRNTPPSLRLETLNADRTTTPKLR